MQQMHQSGVLPQKQNLLHPFTQANFMVEEKGFFSNQQFLLTVSADVGISWAPFTDPDSENRTIVHWDQLQHIGPSPTNLTEFIISYTDVGIAHDLYGASSDPTEIGQAQPPCTQKSLHCAERSLLVCKLEHLISRWRKRPAALQVDCLYQMDNGATPITEDASAVLSLHQTAIEIAHKISAKPRYVQIRQLRQPNGLKPASEIHTYRGQASPMNDPIQSDKLAFYKGSQVFKNDILFTDENNTPRNIVTTESISHGNQENSRLSQSPGKNLIKLAGLTDVNNCTQTILLCNVVQLLQIYNKLLIVTNQQEIDWIVLRDPQQASEVASHIWIKYRQLLPVEMSVMHLHTVLDLTSTQLQDEINFMKWPENHDVVFKMKADTYCKKFNVLMTDQTLQFDQFRLYELDQDNESAHPIKQANLKTLNQIQLVNNNQNYNLVLEFASGVEFRIKTRQFQDRERIVASLLTLRGFLFQNDQGHEVDVLQIVQNGGVRSDTVIHGYEPIFKKRQYKETMTLDFEKMLLQKLGHGQDPESQSRILETILPNCHFFSIKDPKLYDISVPVQVLSEIIKDYLTLEQDEYETISNILMNNSGCRASRGDLLCFLGAQDDTSFGHDSSARLSYTPKTKMSIDLQVAAQDKSDFPLNRDLTSQERQIKEDSVDMAFEEEAEDTELERARLRALSLTELAVKALNVLQSLLNSSLFFSQVKRHTDLVENLSSLLMSKNSLVALLSARVLRAIFHHRGVSSMTSQERDNKCHLLNINQVMNTARESGSSAAPSFDLLSTMMKQLEKLEHVFDTDQKVFSLHLTGMHFILSTVLKEHYATTPQPILEAFYRELNTEPDSVSFVAGVSKSGTTLPKIALIDKFSLCHAALMSTTSPVYDIQSLGNTISPDISPKRFSHLTAPFNQAKEYEPRMTNQLEEYFDVQYLFSMLLCQNLKFVSQNNQNISSKQKEELFEYLLSNTMQFIWHLYLQETTHLQMQKDVSIDILALILSQHPQCPSLLERILPSTLRQKMNPYRLPDRYGAQNWQNWRIFFKTIFPVDLNNPREQWHDALRKELTQKLAAEIHDFISEKQSIQQEKMRRSERIGSFRHSSVSGALQASGEYGGALSSHLLRPAKWNYTEFEVIYDCLAQEYFVGGYYLPRLLETEAEFPAFRDGERINNAGQFWDQLQVSFMTSVDKNEQRWILMTLCQLYKDKFQDIGKIKSLGYWLRLIENPVYAHCQFLLLQLVHIALSRVTVREKRNCQESEHVAMNLCKFIKEGGFLILHNCLNLVFKELPKVEVAILDQFVHNNNGGGRSFAPLTASQQDLFEVDQVEERCELNFTENKTHAMYFRRNSKNVNLAILSLKIFDLIFTNMQFIDNLPMSSNRRYLLQEHSLATLTQTIMLENADLTREVLIFIEKHLSDHYTFYQMRQLGMIEFLILCLSTRNNFRALKLLKIFQQVCLQFNQQLKLGGELAANDLKMILEDKQKREREDMNLQPPSSTKERQIIAKNKAGKAQETPASKEKNNPLLGDSIFLRYLPVPFIQYLYDNDDQRFLEIYRRHDYKHPTLIWNASMRQTLENKIKNNARNFLQRLSQFAHRPEDLNDPKRIPVFERSVSEIVKYEQIENEVRCGRYYLGVWTTTKTEFTIEESQEPEFHQKMQAELRYCIYEENLKNPDKIIILFKMCLLALKKFNSSRINSLNEIKRILLAICKPKSFENVETGQMPQNYGSQVGAGLQASQNEKTIGQSAQSNEKKMPIFPYNQKTRELIYIGTKIFHEAIMKDDVNNKTEIFTMNGVEIMSDIVSFILANTFKAPKMRPKSDGKQKEVNKDQMSVIHESNLEHSMLLSDFPKEPETPFSPKAQKFESHQEIQITAIEAETLLLSMQATHRLLEEDTQSFIDIRLDQRIEIFTQMTQILNLSFKLYDLIDNRDLNMHATSRGNTGKNQSGQQHSFMAKSRMVATEDPNQSSIHDQRGLTTGPGLKRRKKPKKVGAAVDQKADKQRDRLGDGDDGEGDADPMKAELYYGLQKDQVQYPLIKILQNCKNRRSENKSQKNEREKEKYVVDLILKIAKSIFEMMKHITYQPQLHPELIASGLVWQALRHAFFDLKVYFDLKDGLVPRKNRPKEQYKKLKKILDNATQSVMLMVSFSMQFNKSGADAMQFKNLTKKQENGIMINFHKCIQKIFTKKMQDELFCKFNVSNDNKLVVQGDLSGQNFLNLFSISEFNSPELIWNDNTRAELLEVLQAQVDTLIAEEISAKAEQLDVLISDKSRSRQVSLDTNEAADVSASQLANVTTIQAYDKFCNVMLRFEYTVHNTELRVDDIFVNHFNNPQLTEEKDWSGLTNETKKMSFARAIIERLRDPTLNKTATNTSITLEKPREKDTEKLVQAFCRLMTDFQLRIVSQIEFNYYFDTLCSLINLEIESADNSPQQQEITVYVLKIVQHIVEQRLGAQAGDLNQVRDIDLRYAIGADAGDQDELCEFLLGHENRSLLNLLMDVLEQKGASDACIELKQRVISILKEIIKLHVYVCPLFTQQGILVFLLKILFDRNICIEHKILEANRNLDGLRSMLPGMLPDIRVMDANASRDVRLDLLDIILKVELAEQTKPTETLFNPGEEINYEASASGVLKAFLPQNFLLELLDKMKEDLDNQEVITNMQKEWLENFKKTEYESVFVRWNNQLRQQSFDTVMQLCKAIREQPSEQIELKKLSAIIDPKLNEEERIEEIMLRVYNRKANVYIKMRLQDYIVKIVDQLEGVQQELYYLRHSEDVSKLSTPIMADENLEEVPQSQKKFHYVCHRAQLLLTALLLSIEQLMNVFNPNVKNFRRDEDLQAQDFMANTTIDNKVFQSLKVWLQSPVFIDEHIPPEVRITFVQVLYLVVSAKGALAKLRGETLHNFIADMIVKIANRGVTEEIKGNVSAAASQTQQETTSKLSGYIMLEDSLMLMTVQKLLQADTHNMLEIREKLASEHSLKNLVFIAQHRSDFVRDIEYIYGKIRQAYQGRNDRKYELGEMVNKLGGLRAMDTDIILEREKDMQSGKKWRVRPTSASDAKELFNNQDRILETFVRDKRSLNELNKAYLPLISQKSITKYDQKLRPEEDYSENHSRSTSMVHDIQV